MSMLDEDARDLAALQGVWQQVGFEQDGVRDPPDSLAASGALTTIFGNRFAVDTPAGERLLEGRFELQAASRAITWIDATGADAGKRLPARYRLTDERFVFIAADADAPRPTEFRTVPGLTMRSFVRMAR